MKLMRIVCVLTVFLFSAFRPCFSHAEINDSLRAAIINGNIEEVKLFIGNGADVNYVYEDGSTPLLEAIDKSNGSSDIVTLLLQYSANPKLKPAGYSPLSAAKRKNNEEIVRLLRHYAEDEGEFYDLAVYYRDRKEEASALECADKAVKLNPLNSEAWELKGSIYFAQKNIKESESAYHNAYKAWLENLKTNQSPEGYTSAVWCALLSADFNNALEIGKEGLSHFPESGSIALNMGHALLFLGNKKEVMAFYNRAYSDFKQSDKYGAQAAQQVMDDFIHLKERFPDKAKLIAWAEKRLFVPFDFAYGEIPFGENKDAVLKLVDGADVKKDETAVIGIADSFLKKQFGDGLYSNELKTRLDPSVVEKYSITCDKWADIEHIDLFFTVLPGQGGQGALFLVSRFFKEQRGKTDILLNAARDAVTKETGLQPAVHTTQIMSRFGAVSIPVKIVTWKLPDSTIVLDVVNASSSSVQPRVLAVSTKGWETYLKSLPINKPR